MHIAVILDGNGRWAARRNLPRTAGHRAGAKAVDAIVQAAAQRGIDTLTLEVEPWLTPCRPSDE